MSTIDCAPGKSRKKLGFLDRFLTLWIFLAMLLGVLLGNIFPEIPKWSEEVSYGSTNIPLAVGLILMMYPPLVKVQFSKVPKVFAKTKLMLVSFFVTWVIGPFLMFILAITFLADYPEYMTGLIIIGLAPCIAMVIVWNELASGNRELVAGLVGINSLLQVFFFGLYAWFYLEVVLPAFGFEALAIDITIADIATTVGIYLGFPFVSAVVTRYAVLKWKGEEWLNSYLIPKISPITLISLLFTIVFMFSLKGAMIAAIPLDVLRVALPLVFFFGIMFFLMFILGKWAGASYEDNAALSFTASGNNFELAIAVSIGVFGINSGQAFAGVIGPLVEVPALILMVQIAYWLKSKWYKS